MVIKREARGLYTDPDRVLRFPPTPEAIGRMEGTMRWVLWLEEPQRHLAWLRAGEWKWQDIARTVRCDRTKARRRRQRASFPIAVQLSSPSVP